ncbi:MAG: DUF1295 domain-containing protein [Polyangiaceae bacterium]
MPRSISRPASLFWVSFAYLAALGVAAVVARMSGPATHPLWVLAAADAAATVTVFAFSVGFDNTSMYDPYWSVAPIAIGPWLASRPVAANAPLARTVLVIALVSLWGVRLTYNWAVGSPGLSHEDWRYAEYRTKAGRAYWLLSFFGLHFMPTVMVFLGCLPLLPALTSARPIGALDVVAAAVTLGAIAIETVADAQLRAFRRKRKGPSEMLDTGLWALSRHPNYFGEVMFWWGVFLFGVASGEAAAWTAAGALAITALFAFISIPMMDRRSAARRPEYAEYMRRVSRLVPWFPRR